MTRKISALLIATLLMFPSNIFAARVQNTGATSAAAIPAAGGDGNVQYNDGGILAGEADFDYDDATNTLSVPHVRIGTMTALAVSTVVVTSPFKIISDTTPQLEISHETFPEFNVRINHAGTIRANNAASGNLTLNNNGVDGIVIVNGGYSRFIDGLVSRPAISFQSDIDTGMYLISPSSIAFSMGGVSSFRLDAFQAFAGNGLVGRPSYSFISDDDSGIYKPAASQVGVSIDGGLMLNVTTSGSTLAGNSSSQRFEMTTDGTNLAPALVFTGEGTGIYQPAANSIGFTNNSVLSWAIGSTGIFSAQAGTALIANNDGVVGTPSYSFASDPNTGLYSVSPDALGIASNGYEVITISTTSVVISSSPVTISNSGGSGNPAVLNIENSNDTADSDAILQLLNGGTAGGDTYVRFNEKFERDWYFGVDNSAATMVWGLSEDLITSPLMTLTNTGSLTTYDVITSTDGAVGAPTYSFSADTNMGIYRISSGIMGFAVTGGEGARLAGDRFQISSGLPLDVSNGTAGSPAVRFVSDTNTGMYRASEDVLAFATGGTIRSGISNAAGLFISGAGTYTFGNASNYPSRSYFGSGTVGAPSITFGADASADTGIYLIGANSFGFATGGGVRLEVHNGGTIITGGELSMAISGTVSAPAIRWTGTSANTGLYLSAVDQLTVTTDGVARALIDGTSFRVTSVPIYVDNGLVGTPSYTFNGDPNTGIYSTGVTGNLAFSSDGTERMRMVKTATARDVSFMIYDVDNATLEQVTVGIADSGGAGFKVLRIPN